MAGKLGLGESDRVIHYVFAQSLTPQRVVSRLLCQFF